VESPRKGVAPRGRYLVAMRPEPAASDDMREMARVLGMQPDQVRDALGSAYPRIVASRASLQDAEGLARVLTARGREAIAWDRETPLVSLFQADRFLMEGGQLILEQRGRGRRGFPARDVYRVVDLRLRSEPPGGDAKASLFGGAKAAKSSSEQLPDRALLIVPSPGWGDACVISTRTIATGSVPSAGVAAAKLLQEAAAKIRALVPEKLVEVRTTAAAMGLEEGDGDPLDRVLQLLARLPPTPAAQATGRPPGL
jgi:hypothetical protein